MDIQLLNKAMKSEARSLGLCDKWFDEWDENSDRDELLEKYIRGIDFCIKHNYPDNEILKKYGFDIINEHGIYIDDNLDGKADNIPTLVVNGKTTGEVTYNGHSVGNVYICGSSDITIYVKDNARVFVEIYGDSRLSIVNRSIYRCFVYKHGGTVNIDGDVLIRNKNNK